MIPVPDHAPQVEFVHLAKHVTDENLEPDSVLANQARHSFKAGALWAMNRSSSPSPVERLRPLIELQKIVADYQSGALARIPKVKNGTERQRANERLELETIYKTLNVVLGHIEALLSAPSSAIPETKE